MTKPTVVIGVGNVYRRDDGVGPAVAGAVEARALPVVRVVRCAAETTALLDAWAGAGLAVVVDAAVGGTPGRVRHCDLAELAEAPQLSSHELSLSHTHELARVLGRAPESVRVVAVEIADAGHGTGLSPAVQSAVPVAVGIVESLVREQSEKALDE